MHATRRVLSILLIAVGLATGVLGDGINCEGSGGCLLATLARGNSSHVVQGLRDGIIASTLDNSTTYNSGDHVICISESLPINIGIGGGGLVSTSLSANVKLGSGGICVFPQNLQTPLTLGKIKDLADALLAHGCNQCGSVPVHYVDHRNASDFNDPSDGILTFNYVGSPYCAGNCISQADGNAGPATTSSATVTATATPAPTTTGKSGSVRTSLVGGWAFAEAGALGLGALIFGLF